jgi:hypothetical protein
MRRAFLSTSGMRRLMTLVVSSRLSAEKRQHRRDQADADCTDARACQSA